MVFFRHIKKRIILFVLMLSMMSFGAYLFAFQYIGHSTGLKSKRVEYLNGEYLDGFLRTSMYPFEFYFTRAVYTGNSDWNYRIKYPSWSTDFPKADRQFLVVLQEFIDINAYKTENPIRLTDPELNKFPFLYLVEAGQMRLTEAEVDGLRRYLLAGGFLFIDDFWGTEEWNEFEYQIHRVLPGYYIEDISLSHSLFHSFFNIREIVQIPNVGQAFNPSAPTYEKDGYIPHVRGIFDDYGRLMVLINWNTDLGDAWEWGENPSLPLDMALYSYKIGVNGIIYAMTH